MDTKLSTTVSVTSTYAGEFAKEYIAAMLQESPTIGKNLLTIKPNIKFKEVVKVLGTSDLVQNQTCDFSPTGSVTLTERILEPKRLQVNLRLCKECSDYLNHLSLLKATAAIMLRTTDDPMMMKNP